jgi:hypothetical protein
MKTLLILAAAIGLSGNAVAGNCEAQLTELKIAQTTLEKQLKVVPAKLEDGSVNRLYEQLMLENISNLALISAQAARCANGATAETTASTTKAVAKDVDALRESVAALKVETERLAEVVALLRQQLVDENTLTDNSLSPCEQRIHELQSKLDGLRSLGYLETHPDNVTVKSQIDSLNKECSSE